MNINEAHELAATLHASGNGLEVTCQIQGDRIAFVGGAKGSHSLDIGCSDAVRVRVHFQGYCENNGLTPAPAQRIAPTLQDSIEVLQPHAGESLFTMTIASLAFTDYDGEREWITAGEAVQMLRSWYGNSDTARELIERLGDWEATRQYQEAWAEAHADEYGTGGDA
jgi:hypothetical protein